MESKFSIYVLSDPITGEIRYVGVTRQELRARLTEHVKESNFKRTSHRHKWIYSLTRKGLRPTISQIEIVEESMRNEREKYWIAELGKTCNLVNATEGGEGLINPSQAVRNKIALGVKKNGYKGGFNGTHSSETRSRISLAIKSSNVFKEAIRNRRKAVIPDSSRLLLASNLGKKFSREHKDKIAGKRRLYWKNLNETIALQCGI